MAEVANARHDHRDAERVGGGDHVGVLHAAARLRDGGDAVLARRARRRRGTGRTRRDASTLPFDSSPAFSHAICTEIDARHLAGADAHGAQSAVGLARGRWRSTSRACRRATRNRAPRISSAVGARLRHHLAAGDLAVGGGVARLHDEAAAHALVLQRCVVRGEPGARREEAEVLLLRAAARARPR